MARITANALRDRVRLEKREEINDGYGGTYGQWVPQFERDACILPSNVATRASSVRI